MNFYKLNSNLYTIKKTLATDKYHSLIKVCILIKKIIKRKEYQLNYYWTVYY